MTRSERSFLQTGFQILLWVGLYAIPLTVPWTVAGVHVAIGLAVLGALGLGLRTHRWPLGRTQADFAMLAFAGACLVATIRSDDPSAGVTGLKKLLLFPIVHLACGAFATRRHAIGALRLFVGALVLASIVATLRFVDHEPGERLRAGSHYMTFAGLLLLAAPMAATAALHCRGRRRVVYVLATVVLGIGLLLGFTRGAWLGAVVAALVLLGRRRSRAIVLVPVLAVVLFAILPQTYRDRALSSFDPEHPRNVDRVRMWSAGVLILRDHPWTGVGLADLQDVYRRYRKGEEGVIHGHLHNNWIQIGATTGVVGLVTFAWLMGSLGFVAWGRPDPDRSDELAALSRGIWGSFWGFQTMGLFEWNFGDVEVTIALYFLLGAQAGTSAVFRELERKHPSDVPKPERPTPANSSEV